MSFGWAAALATIAVLLAYQLVLALAERHRPQRLARSVHASLREDWFVAIRAQNGAELLGVQTLRNALMSASMTASTAALGLMGTVTLAAPSLHASFSEGAVTVGAFTPHVALELVLVGLLFASLVSSVMAVRYYNHASFIVALPAESEVGAQWAAPGAAYVSKAGRLYSWSLRHLMLVVPILASILHPGAGPLAALLVVAVLSGFDRFSPEAAQA
jgi:hypothetical protein